MKRRLRFGCLLMCFMLLFSDMVVFAGAAVERKLMEEEKKKSEASAEAGQSGGVGSAESLAIQKEWGLDDTSMSMWVSVWDAICVTCSKEAAAGIFGNLYAESRLKGNASETGGTGAGIGIAQWSTDSNRTALQNYSSSCGHNQLINVKGYTICSLPSCQATFLLQDLDSGWNNKALRSYNEIAPSYADQGVPQSITAYSSFSEYKVATDVTSAAICMFDCYERGAGINVLLGRPASSFPRGITSKNNGQFFVDEHVNRPAYAKKAYTLFTGTAVAPDQGTSGDMGGTLYTAGYWSEDELAAYCRLEEINIDNILSSAKRENLFQDDLNGLAMWERNNKQDIEENGFIVWCRRIVMLAGILFILWVSLIYCAYWFDRVNNFFYIDMLGILTLGHLHMSDTEQECTFHVQDIGKEGRKTVNHKTILFICIVGIAFGVCIVTGVFYDFLQFIVYKIFKLLGKY